MKKTFSLLVLFLLVVTGAFAQRSVAMREVHGIRFVVPTIDLLIRYAEQDFEAWKKEMSSLGLTCMSDDADAPIYQQGKPGEMVLAIGKTRKGVTSFSWFNLVDKTSFADDLCRLLQPYASGKGGRFQYYAYGDWIIGVEKSEAETMLFEQIMIRPR